MNYSGYLTDKDGNKYYTNIREIQTTGLQDVIGKGWRKVIRYNVSPLFEGAFLVSIVTNFNNDNNMSAILAVNIAYQNATITNLSAQCNKSIISEVRIVKDSTNQNCDLEIYYNSDKMNRVEVNVFEFKVNNSINIQMLNFVNSDNSGNVLDKIIPYIPTKIKSENIVYFTPTNANVSNYEGYGNCYYYRVGSRVHLHIGVKIDTTKTELIYILPTGYKPITALGYVGIGASMSSYATIQITTDGGLNIYSSSGYALIDCEYDTLN